MTIGNPAFCPWCTFQRRVTARQFKWQRVVHVRFEQPQMAAKWIGLYSLFYRSKVPCKTLVPLRPAYSQSEHKKFLADGESKGMWLLFLLYEIFIFILFVTLDCRSAELNCDVLISLFHNIPLDISAFLLSRGFLVIITYKSMYRDVRYSFNLDYI